MFSHIDFGGQVVRLEHDDRAKALIDFLFAAMSTDTPGSATPAADYRIEFIQESWQVQCGTQSSERFETLNLLGNFLAGDVLFRLIESNQSHLAIHAGLASSANGAVLLPAESGSGKTSVTAWLVHHGWHYHTDELVLIDPVGDDHHAFSRPLNIKSPGLKAVTDMSGIDTTKLDDSKLRQAAAITMIHPSVLENSSVDSSEGNRTIKAVVFPQFSATAIPEMTRLSSAAAGLELMKSNVIARNFHGHGFSEVVQLVKKTPAFRLRFRHFDDLGALFDDLTNEW